MEMQDAIPEPNLYDFEYPRWIPNETPPNYMIKMLSNPVGSHYSKQKSFENFDTRYTEVKSKQEGINPDINEEKKKASQPNHMLKNMGLRKSFALTPFDSGYYEDTTTDLTSK